MPVPLVVYARTPGGVCPYPPVYLGQAQMIGGVPKVHKIVVFPLFGPHFDPF